MDTFPNGGENVIAESLFQTMAAGAASLTYAELSILPMAKAGWQKYFDDWHAKGWV